MAMSILWRFHRHPPPLRGKSRYGEVSRRTGGASSAADATGRGSAHFHMFPTSGHVNIVEYVIGSICRGSFATNKWNNKSPRGVESKQKSWTTCEAKSADGLEEDSEMEVDVDGRERQRRRGSSEEQEDKLEECHVGSNSKVQVCHCLRVVLVVHL